MHHAFECRNQKGYHLNGLIMQEKQIRDMEMQLQAFLLPPTVSARTHGAPMPPKNSKMRGDIYSNNFNKEDHDTALTSLPLVELTRSGFPTKPQTSHRIGRKSSSLHEVTSEDDSGRTPQAGLPPGLQTLGTTSRACVT